jgi:hypothetical protein
MNVPASAGATRPRILWPALAITTVVVSCMIYANLSFAVSRSNDYRYFPPFQPGINRNMNWELGHEYFNIARSLADGQGFAHPFPGRTGPTAWMPPVLPLVIASLWWICDGDRVAVLVIVLVVQTLVLIATGLLALMIARQSTRCVGPGTVAALFIAALLVNFRDCFQANGDRWISLLILDLMIAGFCWGRPLERWPRALCWGFFGGVCALISPIAAFAWGMLSIAIGLRHRAWTHLLLMLLAAALALAPWTIRNYLVFGRWIPVKSNLAYELYQSHCLQTDGILQGRTLSQHPYQRTSRERRAYEELGEAVYLERKAEQFRVAVLADPVELLDRIAARFLGATLWYVPMDRSPADHTSWWVWVQRLTHPWPFLALILLVVVGIREPLPRETWLMIALYLLYLTPYIATSYYERYAFPLLAAKVLLVVWACDGLLSLWCSKTSEVLETSEV